MKRILIIFLILICTQSLTLSAENTYKVSDLFGNKATNASYQITNVKDTKAPSGHTLSSLLC